MNLIWTELALKDYDLCINYLEKKFSEKEIIKFIFQMDYTINLILKNPTSFPNSNYKDIRYTLVIPQVTLFYKVIDSNAIQIIRIWQNRMNKKDIR